jgi:deoxycytidylate deaminase
MVPSWFRLCKIVALKATGDYKLGSCLVRSGRVLSTGYNIYNRSDSISRRYALLRSIHSEINCLATATHRNREIRGSVMYVCRIRKDGSYGLSRPCRGCMEALRDLGVKRVVYSTVEAPYWRAEVV